MKKTAIVLYPSAPIGHMVPMVELGKLILTCNPSLIIHILITVPSIGADNTASYRASVTATNPTIIFHRLPTISLPPSHSSATHKHHEISTFELIHLNNPNVVHALLSISSSDYSVQAFIMDFFCFPGLSAASELNIPAYFLFSTGASSLCSFLYFPTLHNKTDKSLKDLNTFLTIPGVPPMPSSDMPTPVLERNNKAYEYFLESASVLPKSAGIIVNTFQALEPRAIKAISDGLCLAESNIPTPPIFCVGPLIKRGGDSGGDGHECLTWLDSQPKGSVVFLCFGSLGLFSKEQLEEIAIGLEKSGQRFLWVVRSPPQIPAEVETEDLLPEGFLGRTKDRGMVVKWWAPQMDVLNHESVGGFVTHCGWNSVLEAVSAGGVAMSAWPLYAEQRFNRVVLVEEIKIALPMVEESKDEAFFVTAAEVEKRVRELINSKEGDSVRNRAQAMKKEADAVLLEGGSSRLALTRLIESWGTTN